MRVLFVNTVFGAGSTGRIVQDIGKVLEKNGHQYKVLYGRKPKTDDSHAIFIGGAFDAKIHAGLSRITDKCGFYSKESTEKAVSFIREYNPDVIHLHNLHGYYINLEVLFTYFKSEYKGKIIWTLHDCWAFTGHCVNYSYAKCYKWVNHCYDCGEKRRYPTSYGLDSSSTNYAIKKELFTGLPNLTIVTPSNWLATQVSRSFLKEYPCVVVNNGINLDVFQPNESLEKEKYVINIADGLDERKGFNDIVKISKLIAPDIKVVVVGLKKNELKKVPSSIKAICRTDSQEELASYYRNAMYMLNPTYEDNFPTVNIESLACGTPVITYQSGGSPEVVDEETGVVVEPGDINAVVSAIMSGETFDRKKCRKRAMNYNMWDKYQNYIDLYYNEERL